MAPPPPRPKEQPQLPPRTAQNAQPRAYIRPFRRSVFTIFLLVFMMPWLYDWISPEPIRNINDTQLQEIASLMDDIYTTLAKMTFIPATAIKRGPHHINASAFQCNHASSVPRLMELLPYVDHVEVQEDSIDGARTLRTDWFYGGEFIDYRSPRDQTDSCDPLRSWVEAQESWVALTSWGMGGWNGDRTNALVYDTSINAIGVWDGEEWVHITDEHERWQEHRQYYDYTGIGLFNHSLARPLTALHKDDNEWNIWLDAPTFLRRVLHAYQSLAWTPWETSNREDGWGVDSENIRALLGEHGWPDNFDPDNFNAAFIRAKHAAITTHGPAEAVHKEIEELEGPPDMVGAGAIYGAREQLMSFEQQVRSDEQEHWYWVYRSQVARWDLKRLQADLERAEGQFQHLCPDGVCVKPGEEVLWELFSIEKEYEKMKRSTPVEEQCATELGSWRVDDGVNVTDTMQQNCVANRQRVRDWLKLAYQQAKADAEAYCSTAGCNLIPQLTLEQLVRERIDTLERGISLSRARAETMEAWLPALPEHAEKARKNFDIDLSHAVDGPHYSRKSIDRWKNDLAGGDDGNGHVRLWECFDGDGCV